MLLFNKYALFDIAILLMLVYDIIIQEQGIKLLTNAIAAWATSVERHKGKLTVKESPRAVSI